MMGDRNLEEEVKNDEQSKRKSQIKSSTNESAFKNPGHHTPVKKKHNGGSTSGMSSGSRDTN